MKITTAIIRQAKQGKKSSLHTWMRILTNIIIKICMAIILIGLSYVIVYPVIYCASQAFKDPIDMYDATIILIPKHFTLDNFFFVWGVMDYGNVFIQTFYISFFSTVFQVISCALAGYGFARFNFKFKGLLFGILLFSLIVPPQTLFINLYTTFRYFDPLWIASLFYNVLGNPFGAEGPYFDLVDNVAAFWLPAIFASGIRGSLFIFVYRQFFSNFPKELEESAFIDGCGAIRTFLKILVPNSVPAFTTVFLFCLVWYWNDMFYVPMFLSDAKTMPKVVSELWTDFTNPMNATFAGRDIITLIPAWRAGILLYIAPLLILYIVLQRKFTESIERTGIVG